MLASYSTSLRTICFEVASHLYGTYILVYFVSILSFIITVIWYSFNDRSGITSLHPPLVHAFRSFCSYCFALKWHPIFTFTLVHTLFRYSLLLFWYSFNFHFASKWHYIFTSPSSICFSIVLFLLLCFELASHLYVHSSTYIVSILSFIILVLF